MKKNEKLDILYEDKDILVVNKPHNLLTISTNNEKENTLFHKAYMYLKRKNKNNKIFIVHRLDKDTSGIVVFAKSELIKKKMQNNWDKTIRKYVAVVNGHLEKNKDTLRNYLAETKTLLVYVTDSKNGELAITSYEKVSENNQYTLVNIDIKTGKKNQIRVQFNEIGHSIVGDKKYGIKKDPLRRMCLHANYIEFNHPATNKIMKIETNVPKCFINLMNQ